MTSEGATTVFSTADAMPEAVAGALRPFTYPVGQPVPWTTVLSLLDANAGGEIRQPSDWERLPRDESVLVVALQRDGEYVIRWGTRDGLGAATGGIIHDCLLGPGDEWTDLRKGFAILTRDGRVRLIE
jgi:hypothetical protein